MWRKETKTTITVQRNSEKTLRPQVNKDNTRKQSERMKVCPRKNDKKIRAKKAVYRKTRHRAKKAQQTRRAATTSQHILATVATKIRTATQHVRVRTAVGVECGPRARGGRMLRRGCVPSFATRHQSHCNHHYRRHNHQGKHPPVERTQRINSKNNSKNNNSADRIDFELSQKFKKKIRKAEKQTKHTKQTLRPFYVSAFRWGSTTLLLHSFLFLVVVSPRATARLEITSTRVGWRRRKLRSSGVKQVFHLFHSSSRHKVSFSLHFFFTRRFEWGTRSAKILSKGLSCTKHDALSWLKSTISYTNDRKKATNAVSQGIKKNRKVRIKNEEVGPADECWWWVNTYAVVSQDTVILHQSSLSSWLFRHRIWAMESGNIKCMAYFCEACIRTRPHTQSLIAMQETANTFSHMPLRRDVGVCGISLPAKNGRHLHMSYFLIPFLGGRWN